MTLPGRSPDGMRTVRSTDATVRGRSTAAGKLRTRPKIAAVLSVATFDPPLSERRSGPPWFALNIFDILSSFQSLLRWPPMRFRHLSRDPFTDIGRTLPEFRPVGLAESKEFHGFSVDKKNVLEIDDEAAPFLFQYDPKHVDVFPCNPAADEQHHEAFSGNDSIDSAAYLRLPVQSFHPFYRSGLRRTGLASLVDRARFFTHDSGRDPIGFPRPPRLCFTKECQGRRFAVMCDANPIMLLNLSACHQIRERMDEQSFDSAL